MKNIIEDFYFGNINPQASAMGNRAENQKALQRLTKLEKQLTEAIDESCKKDFFHFVNTMDEAMSESNLDSFIVGFRLGARLIYDTFCDSEFRKLTG